MLEMVFFLTIIIMSFFSIFAAWKMNSKFSKTICIIVVIFFYISFISLFSFVNSTAFKEPTISTIEITEVYEDDMSEYCIKTTDSDKLIKVYVNTVYKGDKNYLIRREYPKMTKFQDSIKFANKVEYDLVVTDFNIPKLSSIE